MKDAMMDVAFLGLGQMGSGMASQLIGAGHDVTVWNRNAAKARAFAQQGAKTAQSPEDAARTGIAMTMLANDHAVEAVVFGENGILSAGRDVLHISCSTISVELTKRLVEAHHRAGQRFVSAQVLGRPDVSAAGKLSVLAAGASADLDTAQPLFDAIGSGTFRIGDDPVMAVAVKLAANFGITAIIEMLSEQFRIAGAHGVEPSQMAQVLIGTDFGNRMIRSYGPMIAGQQFEPAGFPMRLGRKDVGLALAAGEGEQLPLAQMIAARMDTIIAADGGERDWSALGQPLPE